MTALSPSIFALPHVPAPSDAQLTATLIEQQETEFLISQLLTLTAPPSFSPNDQGTVLRKTEHSQFVASTFFKLPSAYISLDASRPWLMFWSVHSLDLLGVALDQATKDRAISTLLHFVSPLGGFAGGPSNTQLPHLLPTYASVSSLAIVGSSAPGGGWETLAKERQNIYDFFMRCKRTDGGFVVCEGGEVDVRGTYCLLVVATLLDLLTPELLRNVDTFLSSCQTYEGGFACSAHSGLAQAEAHGGYTSCALFSHFLLAALPQTESLGGDFPLKIDVEGALRWSVLQQGEAIEAGGFRGRTNKLVDGCYGWWVGGGFPVLEELVKRERRRAERADVAREERDEGDEEWEDMAASPPLFNRGTIDDCSEASVPNPSIQVALQEFILLAAQKEPNSTGGLRDKPGKRPDLYHSCNNLSGLSIAQHHVQHSSTLLASNRKKFDPTKGLPAVKTHSPDGGWKDEEERQRVRRAVWSEALAWEENSSREIILGGKDSRVNTTTPVFNILLLRIKPFINYFYGQVQ
ncbi:protein farnesyltransferase subunit beta, partial [Tremellales sp. Uapishka_1]